MKTKTFTLKLPAAQAAYITSVSGETVPNYMRRLITDKIECEHHPKYGAGSPNDPPEYARLKRRYDKIQAELGDRTLRNVKVGANRARKLVAEMADIESRLIHDFEHTYRRVDMTKAA